MAAAALITLGGVLGIAGYGVSNETSRGDDVMLERAGLKKGEIEELRKSLEAARMKIQKAELTIEAKDAELAKALSEKGLVEKSKPDISSYSDLRLRVDTLYKNATAEEVQRALDTMKIELSGPPYNMNGPAVEAALKLPGFGLRGTPGDLYKKLVAAYQRDPQVEEPVPVARERSDSVMSEPQMGGGLLNEERFLEILEMTLTQTARKLLLEKSLEKTAKTKRAEREEEIKRIGDQKRAAYKKRIADAEAAEKAADLGQQITSETGDVLGINPMRRTTQRNPLPLDKIDKKVLNSVQGFKSPAARKITRRNKPLQKPYQYTPTTPEEQEADMLADVGKQISSEETGLVLGVNPMKRTGRNALPFDKIAEKTLRSVQGFKSPAARRMTRRNKVPSSKDRPIPTPAEEAAAAGLGFADGPAALGRHLAKKGNNPPMSSVNTAEANTLYNARNAFTSIGKEGRPNRRIAVEPEGGRRRRRK